MLAPGAPLLEQWVPYLIKGIIREKLNPPLRSFSYPGVKRADAIQKLTPSTSEPHFTIPVGYPSRYRVNKARWGTSFGENVCTIGMFTERYYFNYHRYLRIKFMEGNESALIIRANRSLPAPTLGSLGLACGTKSSAPDVYDDWQSIGKFLDTSMESGKITLLLRGATSTFSFSHEYLSNTSLVVKSGSPVDLHAYDNSNHHIGAIYNAQGIITGYENQLSNAEHFPSTDENQEVIRVNNPTSALYSLRILGRDNSVYTETIHVCDCCGEQTYLLTLPNQPPSTGRVDVINFREIPSTPHGLTLQTAETETILDCEDNPKSDLEGYNIYPSLQRFGADQKLNSQPWTRSTFTDNYLLGWDPNVLVYCYYVTAVDTSQNESSYLTPLPDREIFYLHLPY